MILLSVLALLPLPQIQTSAENLGTAQVQGQTLDTRPWTKIHGGAGADWLLAAAPDGKRGLFGAGQTFSFGAGFDDGWLARLGPRGRTRWEFALGGAAADMLTSVIATPDGGCIAAGTTSSSGAGGTDGWIVKLGPQGAVLWERTYGGTADESFAEIALAADGGPATYYVAGTAAFDKNLNDAWVLALDAAGTPLWQKTYGGALDEYMGAMVPTPDGLVFTAASTSSFGGPAVTFTRPWLVRLDETGVPVAQRTLDYSNGDILADLVALPDGTFAATGELGAMGFFRGDVWVLRLDAGLNVIWDWRFGDNNQVSYFDGGRRILATPEGELIVIGSTATDGAGSEDIWVLQLDGSGTLIHERTFGAGGFDNGLCAAADPDGLMFLGGRVQLEPLGGPIQIMIARVPASTLAAPDASTCPPALESRAQIWTSGLTHLQTSAVGVDTSVVAQAATSVVTPLDTGRFACR